MTGSCRILLVGMMGAGKSTVGHALARQLSWPYYDNDELLRRATGIDTRVLQERAGVGALRRAESAALSIALQEGTPLVASVAGGVVVDPLDRQRLRSGGFVVWLRAELATLDARVAGTDRPWLGAHPAEAMRELYAGREDLYRSFADLIVDVDRRDVDDVADEIVRVWSG
jgi:shikimate kinase